MHIPDNMVEGAICPATAVMSAVSVVTATFFAFKTTHKKPTAFQLAAVAAFIFAIQMMNFPIQNGTSGHVIGATIAAALFGFPFGVLIMSIVLTVQTLLFADGGLMVLGVNIFNMAIVGSVFGGIVHQVFLKEEDGQQGRKLLLVGLSAWLSVVVTAIVCSIELAISDTIALSKVFPAMTGVHALIGVGEAVITVGAYMLFSSKENIPSKKLSYGLPLIAACIIGLLLSPFASEYPDGLEWVATKYNFLHQSAPTFLSPLPDYTFPLINNEFVSGGIAGFLGVVITFFIVWLVGKLLHFNKELQLS